MPLQIQYDKKVIDLAVYNDSNIYISLYNFSTRNYEKPTNITRGVVC